MSDALSDGSAIALGRRQLYMLPTRHGIMFSLVLATMLLAAVNYHNGLAYLFTFLLCSMALVSMLYTHRNLSGLRLRAGNCASVFAGQDASFEVWLHNPSHWFRPAVWLHANGEAQRIDLAPRETVRALVIFRTTKRGCLKPPPITLSTTFPLALLYSWSKRMELDNRCLVYPEMGLERVLPSPADGDRPRFDGRRSEGDDFAGLREYRLGDPPGHVHWKTAARSQGLHTKQFAGHGGGTIWLEWDALVGLDVEARLSLLCRWVVDADAAGLRYGLRIPNTTVKPQHDVEHRHRCLSALALYGISDVQ